MALPQFTRTKKRIMKASFLIVPAMLIAAAVIMALIAPHAFPIMTLVAVLGVPVSIIYGVMKLLYYPYV